MRTSARLFFVISLSLLVPLKGGEGEESPAFLERAHLTGDWGGVRTDLLGVGLDFEVVYTGDVISVVSGGIRRGTEFLANVDLILKGDLEKMSGWRGGSFQMYGLGNYGGNPSEHAGDAQILDHIEAPETWKLYEAWLQQELLSGKLSLLAGLYDLNSEFDVNETGSIFLNSSHGIGVEFAQTGPSIFPVTSLAARLKYIFSENFHAQAAVLDGIAGDPANPRGTQVIFDKDDGLLLVSELAFLRKDGRVLESPRHRIRPGRMTEEEVGHVERITGKLALGAWLYTANFDVVVPDIPGAERRGWGNHGVYLLAEQLLWEEKEHEDEGLSAFLRLGYADPRFNQFGFYSGGGAIYTGLFPGRDADQLGMGVAVAWNGRDFKDAKRREGIPVDAAEVSLEFTYRAQVTGWAVLQGDLQYILNPGAAAEIDDALAIGLRTEITF